MAAWTGLVRFSDGSSYSFKIEADDLEKATEIARRETAGLEIVSTDTDGRTRRIYRTGMMVSIEIRLRSEKKPE